MLVLRMRYDAQRTGESWAANPLRRCASRQYRGRGARGLARPGRVIDDPDGRALHLRGALHDLFTNLYGLASGTISTDGTLLYWLGQHDYRRGEQPWFYYALLLPQYEFIAVSVGTIATIFIGVRMLLVGLGRAKPGPRFIFQSFLAIWFVGILLALSWAGEKMPWLVTHISLPAVLLAAVLLGEVWEHWRPDDHGSGSGRRETGVGWQQADGWGAPQWALLGGLLCLAACWFLLAAPMTYGEFVTSTLPGGWERTIAPWAQQHWWLLAVPPLAGLVAIGTAWLRRGGRLALQPALVALVLVLALAEVHVAWRLVYQEGDVPKDMLVYTQTSPDMQRMVQELTTLSEVTTGGLNLEIWYDDNDGVSWPMQWYLRDFPNRHLYGSTLAGPPDGVPIVLVGDNNRTSVEPYLEGYTAQAYALRWWFPERIYGTSLSRRRSRRASRPGGARTTHNLPAIAALGLSSLSTLLSPETQQRLYRLVMYRDLRSASMTTATRSTSATTSCRSTTRFVTESGGRWETLHRQIFRRGKTRAQLAR